MIEPHETAVVMSGGGSYGAFAVGVLKVLFAGRSPATQYKPLKADILTGTSVGAFNAAMIAGAAEQSCLDAALHLENIWLERIAERPGRCGNGVFRVIGDPAEYLDPNCLRSPTRVASNLATDSAAIGSYFFARTADFLASSVPLRQRIIGLFNLGSFVDSTPYSNLLREVIHEENIFQGRKSLTIVATNWITGKAVRFRNSDFQNGLGMNAIMASTAIPGVFPPVRIGPDIYVDGGVVENTPLTPALDLGATELHVIYLDPNPQFVPISGAPNTLETLLRVYHVMLATKLNEDIETARWINAGLKAFANLQSSVEFSALQARDLVRTASKILSSQGQYKPVTIHRYVPRSARAGQLGALDFELRPILKMIEEGEHTALLHDCAQNNCILASQNERVYA